MAWDSAFAVIPSGTTRMNRAHSIPGHALIPKKSLSSVDAARAAALPACVQLMGRSCVQSTFHPRTPQCAGTSSPDVSAQGLILANVFASAAFAISVS